MYEYVSLYQEERRRRGVFRAKWCPNGARVCLVWRELNGEETREVVEARLAYAVHDHAGRRAVQRAQAAHVHDRAAGTVLHALHHYLRAANSERSSRKFCKLIWVRLFVPESHSPSISGSRRSVYKQHILNVT